MCWQHGCLSFDQTEAIVAEAHCRVLFLPHLGAGESEDGALRMGRQGPLRRDICSDSADIRAAQLFPLTALRLTIHAAPLCTRLR